MHRRTPHRSSLLARPRTRLLLAALVLLAVSAVTVGSVVLLRPHDTSRLGPVGAASATGLATLTPDAGSPTAEDVTVTVPPTPRPSSTPTSSRYQVPPLPANALWVGPGHPYARPCAAIAAAHDGDTIAIDAAGNSSYRGDVCAWSTNHLTLVGVNGRPHLDAAGRNAAGKGIWVINGDNTTVENIEFSGAAVPDLNGAGIRQEGAGLTVRHCYFHDNQDGILANPNPASDITIVASEFARNGNAGDPSRGLGAAHNIYIGHVRRFTLRDSYSHDANQGHLVKSRAAVNEILYNRLTNQTSTASYELDLPNGGLSYVIGNILQKGPNAQNSNLLAYGEEGASNPDSWLYAINNTFVNDRGSGAAIFFAGGLGALAQNNLSVGSPTFATAASVTLKTNCLPSSTAAARFARPTAYDYHLLAGSPCLDAGSRPGVSSEGCSLQPTAQYVYDLGEQPRVMRGAAIDAGAFE